MAANKILLKLSSGDFAGIVQDVENLMMSGGQFINAQLILRKVCSVISDKSSLSILGLDNVEKICKLCCQGILNDGTNIAEVDYKVTSAMYHVISHLRDNDHFDSFLETLDTFLPVLELLVPSADSRQMNVFVQLGVLVYNECLRQFKGNYFKTKDMSEIQSSLIELWQLMLRVSLLSNQNLYLIPRIGGQIVTQYKMLDHGKDVLLFQETIITSLKQFCFKCAEKKTISDLEILNLFIADLCATLIFHANHIAARDWEGAFVLVKEMILNLKMLLVPSSRPFFVICFVEKFLGAILFSKNSVPSMEYFLKQITESSCLLKSLMTDNSQNDLFLQWSTHFITHMLIGLKKYWCANKDKVKCILSTSTISCLYELSSTLSKVIESGRCSKCVNSAGQLCALEEDVPSAFFLMEFMLFLTRVHDVSEEKPELIDILFDCVERCEELTQITVRKQCFQSDDLIFQLCDSTYVVWIYVKDSPNLLPMERKLLKKCKDLYFSVCKTTKESLSCRKSIGFSILKAFAKVLHKLGEAEMACVALSTALSIAYAVNEEPDESIMKFWVLLRNSTADKELSLTTMLMDTKLMKEFWTDYDLSIVNLPKWFLWEMETYNSCQIPEADRLLPLWKSSKKLNLLPLEKIQACARFFQALVVCDNSAVVEKYQEKLKIEDYHVLLKKIPSCDQAVALCALAVLCFARFLCATRLHVLSSENATKAAKTYEPRKRVVRSAEDVVDQNDICTVPPTYSDLIVSKEESLLSLLEPAVTYWQQSLEKGLGSLHICYQEVLVCGQRLPEAAGVCRLFGDRVKERRLWAICRTFGQRINNDKLTLQAVSGLMDLACCEPDWVMRAQNIAENLENDVSAELPLHMFKNSCILQCLLTRKLEDGLVLLNELLGITSASKKSWCMVQTHFLLAKYQLDSPHLFPKDSNKAFYTARNTLKWAKMWADELSSGSTLPDSFQRFTMADLTLSVSLWLGNLFLQVMLPREARCYLKCELVIAQKWGLALRSAQFLSLLAQVDLLVEKVEECVWKIEGMKQVLCSTGKSGDVSMQVDLNTDEDYSQPRLAQPDEPCSRAASPQLKAERFKMPDFVGHKNSCNCFSCIHLGLHKLWLDVGYLQACVYFYQFNVMAAGNFFKSSITLAKNLRQKQERLLHDSTVSAYLQGELICTEVKLKIKYADMLALYKKDAEAVSVNKAVFPLIGKLVPKDFHLFTDALEQQIVLMDLASNSLEAKVQGTVAAADYQPSPKTPPSQETVNIGNSPGKVDADSAFKTPLRTNVQKRGSRARLKAITPASSVPSDDAFVNPTVAMRLLNLSDSDDSLEEDVGTQEKKVGKSPAWKERQKTLKARAIMRTPKVKEKHNSKKHVASASSSVVSRAVKGAIEISESENDEQTISTCNLQRHKGTKTSSKIPEAISKKTTLRVTRTRKT